MVVPEVQGILKTVFPPGSTPCRAVYVGANMFFYLASATALMKKEHLFYYACIALNALPVLLFRFFPSMDGPAHLYNANILKYLWTEQSAVLQQYYSMHPALLPNWTSHVLLAAFGAFLPAFLAEKAMLLLYVVGLPLSFRSLVRRIAPGRQPLSYLIFPFVYNYLFCLGFYNLSLSMVLLFAGLALSVRQIESPSPAGWIAQTLLFTATYFTHPFSFTLLVGGAFAIWIVPVLFPTGLPIRSFSARFRTARWHLLRLSLACALPVLLLLRFYATQHFHNSGENLSNGELMRFIKDVRPLIAYHYEQELRLTEHLFHLFIALTAIAWYERIQRASGTGGMEKWKALFRVNDIWLALAAFLLVLLFVVPNSASAGMMSDRFALLFYLFWVVWMAVQPFPRWLAQAATAVVLILNFALTYRYIRVAKDQNQLAVRCVAAAEHIRPGSIVLPFNYSDNWLAPHFSNYLGIEKPMVILENYEADTGWFPLLWRQGRPSPVFEVDTACRPSRDQAAGSPVAVDYVFVLGRMNAADSCQFQVKRVLDRDFLPVYQSDDAAVLLYQRR